MKIFLGLGKKPSKNATFQFEPDQQNSKLSLECQTESNNDDVLQIGNSNFYVSNEVQSLACHKERADRLGMKLFCHNDTKMLEWNNRHEFVPSSWNGVILKDEKKSKDIAEVMKGTDLGWNNLSCNVIQGAVYEKSDVSQSKMFC